MGEGRLPSLGVFVVGFSGPSERPETSEDVFLCRSRALAFPSSEQWKIYS